MNSEQMTHRTALWVTGPVPPGPVPPGPVPPVIAFDSIIVSDILPAQLMGPLIGRLRAVWPTEGNLASRDRNKWQPASQSPSHSFSQPTSQPVKPSISQSASQLAINSASQAASQLASQFQHFAVG